jgi:hypothetical protein
VQAFLDHDRVKLPKSRARISNTAPSYQFLNFPRDNSRAVPTKEPFPRKRRLHDGAYLTGETAGWRLLLELKIDIGETLLFLEDPFLRWSLLKQRDVLEEGLYNFLVILQAIFCQPNLAIEDSWCAWTYGICTYTNFFLVTVTSETETPSIQMEVQLNEVTFRGSSLESSQ